jgi:hypothetical protein
VTPASTTAPVVYTAVCERVGNWWEITVPELESGGATQARRLDEVPAIVADLVSLMTGVDPSLVKVKVEAEEGPGIDPETLTSLILFVLVAIFIILRSRLVGAGKHLQHLRRAA